IGCGGKSHGCDADRESRAGWSRVDRDPRPGGGAVGRARPRHCRFTETTLDTVRWPTGYGPAAHSCAAPARPDVRSAPARSALPKTRRIAHSEIEVSNRGLRGLGK